MVLYYNETDANANMFNKNRTIADVKYILPLNKSPSRNNCWIARVSHYHPGGNSFVAAFIDKDNAACDVVLFIGIVEERL